MQIHHDICHVPRGFNYTNRKQCANEAFALSALPRCGVVGGALAIGSKGRGSGESRARSIFNHLV